MSNVLAVIVQGVRHLCSRDFWRAYRDYWHPDAVAARLNERIGGRS